MNVGSEGHQFTSRPVTITTCFIENIYAFAALMQIRDKVKYAILFALINLVFQAVLTHFSRFPVLNCCCPETASHINSNTYLVLYLTFTANAITFSLHFELLSLRLCASLIKATRQRSSFLLRQSLVTYTWYLSSNGAETACAICRPRPPL